MSSWQPDPRQSVGSGHSSWWLFAVAFPFVALAMIVMLRTVIFGAPIYEVGDLAANALQIAKAKRFDEIVGNYSRFDFHHPGPAFFYVYALGEWVFHDLLRITAAPDNAHLLAATLLQAIFLVGGVVAVSSLMRRGRIAFVVLACAIALVHFRLAGDPQTSIWPPDVLVITFFTFVACSAVIATGRAGFLPLAVLAGAFLVHGHAGQVLFVVPIFVVAWVLLVRAVRRDRGPGTDAFIEAAGRAHVWAVLIAIPFLATIVLDAIRGPGSNVARILAAGQMGGHPVDSVANYLVSFLTYDVPGGVISVAPGDQLAFIVAHAPRLVLIVALIALPIGWAWYRPATGRGSDRFAADLRTYWGILLVAAVLSVVWVFVQPGDLYGFNSYFLWGLVFAAILPGAMIVVDRAEGRAGRTAIVLAAGIVATIGVAVASPPVTSDNASGREIHAAVPGLLATTDPSRPIYLDMDGLPAWSPAAGLALELEREGRRFEVADGGPSLILGYDHVADPGETVRPIRWILVDPRTTRAFVYRLSDDLAIGRIEDP